MKTWAVYRNKTLVTVICAADEKLALATSSGDAVVEVTEKNREALFAEHEALLVARNRQPVITKNEFLRRLGMKALAEILVAAAKDPMVAAWKYRFDALPADAVNVDDPEMVEGLKALADSGVLSADAVSEVLK